MILLVLSAILLIVLCLFAFAVWVGNMLRRGRV